MFYSIVMGTAVAGRNLIPINPENIKLPPGIYLKSIRPKSIEVFIDVAEKKTLPVQVDWIGRLPDNLILSGLTLEPKEVQVMGGQSILEKVSTIYTEKISIDSFKKSGTTTAKLILNPPSMKLAPGSKNSVIVHYIIREKPEKTESVD